MVSFQPKHRLSYPENYSFSSSTDIFSRSKYPKSILFNFENKSTGQHSQALSRCLQLDGKCGLSRRQHDPAIQWLSLDAVYQIFSQSRHICRSRKLQTHITSQHQYHHNIEGSCAVNLPLALIDRLSIS